jgi:prepilin-type N-terminal cleavage/methylation domain-containing protein
MNLLIVQERFQPSTLNPQLSKGFTLIELLVVIFIIVLLAGIILPGYFTARQEMNLERSAHLVAQFLRKTLEKTIAMSEYRGIIPSGGYGFYLRRQEELYQIFIFADCDNNRRYTDIGTPCGGFPERVEGGQLELESGVKIRSLSPHFPDHSLHIAFRPPDPTAYINGVTGRGVITLSLIAAPTRIRTITVNKVGLISVE